MADLLLEWARHLKKIKERDPSNDVKAFLVVCWRCGQTVVLARSKEAVKESYVCRCGEENVRVI